MLSMRLRKPPPAADWRAKRRRRLFAKATAKCPGPASERMLQLAEEHRKIFPNKTPEQAYVAVYEDRRSFHFGFLPFAGFSRTPPD